MKEDQEPLKLLNGRAVKVPISKLVEHPKNARKSDEELLSESMDVLGFYRAVVVNKRNNYILSGNGRCRVAKKKGLKKVPVYWVDVDKETELKILSVANRANDVAGYYEKALVAQLEKLARIEDGFRGSGFSEEGFKDLIDHMKKSRGEHDQPVKGTKYVRRILVGARYRRGIGYGITRRKPARNVTGLWTIIFRRRIAIIAMSKLSALMGQCFA